MTAWPAVAGWLVANLPNLPGWADVTVFDGPPATSISPPSWASVGYVEDEDAGSYRTDPSPVDGSDLESGEVRCQIAVNTGLASLAAARDATFTLVGALEDRLRSDPTLGGVLTADATCQVSVAVGSFGNAQGSAQSVVVSVEYTTRRT